MNPNSKEQFSRRSFLARTVIAPIAAAGLSLADRSQIMPVLDAVASLAPAQSPLTKEQILAGLGNSLATPLALAQAECIGPNVQCPIPDAVARFGLIRVNRVLRNPEGVNFAVSDAAVRVYLLKEMGGSKYPKLNLKNPILGPNELPIAFLDENTGLYREVRESLLFVTPPTGSERFNGRLYLEPKKGSDIYRIVRPAGEIRDRALGRRRGTSACHPGCEVNCAVIAVWERQVGASSPVTFKDSQGLPERDQTAIWIWPEGEASPTTHDLTSFTELPDKRIRDLIVRREAGPSVYVGPEQDNSDLELIKD